MTEPFSFSTIRRVVMLCNRKAVFLFHEWYNPGTIQWVELNCSDKVQPTACCTSQSILNIVFHAIQYDSYPISFLSSIQNIQLGDGHIMHYLIPYLIGDKQHQISRGDKYK